MKKRPVFIVGVTLTFIFCILFGIQYVYYEKAWDLRKTQTLQLAKVALSETAHEMELNELLRYINTTIGRDAGSKAPSAAPPNFSSSYPGGDKSVDESAQSNIALSESVISDFLNKRQDVDELMLRHLYESYDYDSIPQMVNPKYLREYLRKALDDRGIKEAYSVVLCTSYGEPLFQYTQPGVIQHEMDGDNAVLQRIFVKVENPSRPSPFLRLTLDFDSKPKELMSIALPGLISSVIVLILGVIIIVTISRQETFQREKTNFINNMTHELKTPVSSILLAQELLSDHKAPKPEERVDHYLSIIKVEAKRLQMLIEKSLQFSLLDGKVSTMHYEVLDINDLILSVSETYTLHAMQTGGDLELDLLADDTWIRTDKMHMLNVLSGLLENSVKYSRQGVPLMLKIHTENTKYNGLLLYVQDNGIGIPEESLSKVFDRYYRVPTGNRHDVKGYGLGLAYVRTIVRMLGGKVRADHAPGGGTRISIRLPLAQEGGGGGKKDDETNSTTTR